MSRLALEWAKKNFNLGNGSITSTEKNFSDGCLFLSMLKQRGLLTDDDAVNESGTPFAAQENLKLVKKKLKDFNIFIDKKVIGNVRFYVYSLIFKASFA